MNKILVLAEKPSVGRDIARVLKCKKNIGGGIECNLGYGAFSYSSSTRKL